MSLALLMLNMQESNTGNITCVFNAPVTLSAGGDQGEPQLCSSDGAGISLSSA